MVAYADLKERPDWLKDRDRAAFDRYMRSRRDRPRAAVLMAVVDLAHGAPPLIEYHISGAAWQHLYALAARMLELLKLDPDLTVGAEILQARLDLAIEALDVRNVWLETGAVK